MSEASEHIQCFQGPWMPPCNQSTGQAPQVRHDGPTDFMGRLYLEKEPRNAYRCYGKTSA